MLDLAYEIPYEFLVFLITEDSEFEEKNKLTTPLIYLKFLLPKLYIDLLPNVTLMLRYFNQLKNIICIQVKKLLNSFKFLACERELRIKYF